MGEIRRFRMVRDYFTADNLETLTGVYRSDFERFIFKELLENGLDATENQETRKIEVQFEAFNDAKRLSVFDNGPGISGRLLEQIYTQFDSYLSSKKGYRAPTRGYQGNALKTVIGICDIRKFELIFMTREGEEVAYTLDQTPSGDIGVRRVYIGNTDRHGVAVTGHFRSLCEDDLMLSLRKYHLSNPDVTFSFNGSELAALTPGVKRKETTYISWYDPPSFQELIVSSAYTSSEEHRFDFSREQVRSNNLCERIAESLAIDIDAGENPVSWLNRLLETSDFMDRCRAKNLAIPRSSEIDALDPLTSTFRRETFEHLGDTEKGYIKWLNRALLEALYPNEIRKAPRTTVRAFLEKNFSQVQRIVKHLAVSGMTLTDLAANQEKIASLLLDLQSRVKPPRDRVLEPYLTGRQNLTALLHEGSYKATFDHYEIPGPDKSAITCVPFAIEAFLVKVEETPFLENPEVIIAVNNSIPLDDPFRFYTSDIPEMGGDAIRKLRKAVEKRFPIDIEAQGQQWLEELLERKDFPNIWLDKVCDFIEEELPQDGELERTVKGLEKRWGRRFGPGTAMERLNASLCKTALYTRLGEPSLPGEIDRLAQSTAEYRKNPFRALTPLAQVAVKEFNAALLHVLYPAIPQRKRLALDKEVAELIQTTEATRQDTGETDRIIRLNRLLLKATFGVPGDPYQGYDLGDFFRDKGLGRDYLLYLSLVCPVIQVRDKAKNSIVADQFKAGLLSTISSVLRSLPKTKEPKLPSRISVKELMRQYLQPAL